MRSIILAALLVSVGAYATPTGALFNHLPAGPPGPTGPAGPASTIDGGTVVTATSSALAMFANASTGNDSNDCLSAAIVDAGLGPCLTLQGAFNKSPKLLRHQLTVTAAAGNYAGVTISGFTVDPSTQRANAGILLDGALANVTPATGSAVGTASSGSAGSNAVFGTLTDSAATWTVNDPAFVGKFIVITGGTGSGQIKVIVSNTATTLTIAGTWTAPTGTSTYAIQAPSVHITTPVALIPNALGASSIVAAGIQVADNTIASNIQFRNIDIAVTGAIGSTIQLTAGTVSFLQTTIEASSNLGGWTFGANTLGVVTSSSYITSGTGFPISASSGSGTVTGCYLKTSNTDISVSGVTGVGTINSTQLIGTTCLNGQNGATASISLSRCDCSSQANSAGMIAGTIPTFISSTGPSRYTSIVVGGNMDITNCTTGIMASGISSVTVVSTAVLSGNALTYGVNSVWGALVVLPTAITTLLVGPNDGGHTLSADGGFQEMAVDVGANTAGFGYTVNSFDCFSSTTGTGSRICKL